MHGLIADSVSIESQHHYCVGGENLPMGEPHRRAYINSPKGREELQAAEIPDNYKKAILEIWGKKPTVEDEIIEEPTE